MQAAWMHSADKQIAATVAYRPLPSCHFLLNRDQLLPSCCQLPPSQIQFNSQNMGSQLRTSVGSADN